MTDLRRVKIAVLDDYADVARNAANWDDISGKPEISIFRDHLTDPNALVERLRPFEAVCLLIERLPNLKLIASTGLRNAAIDLVAAAEHGMEVVNTRYESTPTIEFTWAMILGLARKIWIENASLRAGGWQTSVGLDLRGKTLGLLGLGNIGSKVADFERDFQSKDNKI